MTRHLFELVGGPHAGLERLFTAPTREAATEIARAFASEHHADGVKFLGHLTAGGGFVAAVALDELTGEWADRAEAYRKVQARLAKSRAPRHPRLLEDEDGIDGPHDRAWAAAMREDARARALDMVRDAVTELRGSLKREPTVAEVRQHVTDGAARKRRAS